MLLLSFSFLKYFVDQRKHRHNQQRFNSIHAVDQLVEYTSLLNLNNDQQNLLFNQIYSNYINDSSFNHLNHLLSYPQNDNNNHIYENNNDEDEENSTIIMRYNHYQTRQL